MDDPGDAAEHDDAEDERQREPDAPRHQPLLGRQARHHERDEDDVVDAEHDLHRAQGDEACPDMRIGQPVDEHAVKFGSGWRCDARVPARANSLAAFAVHGQDGFIAPGPSDERAVEADAGEIDGGDDQQRLHPERATERDWRSPRRRRHGPERRDEAGERAEPRDAEGMHAQGSARR